MTSRSEVCICEICKQKYFEPEPNCKRHKCGHCQLVRSWASNGTPESDRECAEFRRRQIERNITLRPRVNDVLKDIDKD